jgi:2-polyprenyl-3-methyl-5-hydroxy-6-metoxy-1,4-benzoquinol methylase
VLISGEYQALNEECHETNKGWGKGGTKYIDQIIANVRPGERVLDYGCGKGHLARDLLSVHKIDCIAYDPNVPRFSRDPVGTFDMVVCTDVLEHVEEEYLIPVLQHITGMAAGWGAKAFFAIGKGLAVKELSDGSNAHRILMDHDEWRQTLIDAGFHITSEESRSSISEFWCTYGYPQAAS